MILVYYEHQFELTKFTEQVNMFNYLGNMISYEGELDTDHK